MRAKLEDMREEYERQLKYLQEVYDDAMLGLCVKKMQFLLGKDEK